MRNASDPPWTDKPIQGVVCDDGGDVGLNAANPVILAENVHSLAEGFDELSIRVGEIAPFDPRRVAYNVVNVMSTACFNPVEKDEAPYTVPVVPMKLDEIRYCFCKDIFHFDVQELYSWRYLFERSDNVAGLKVRVHANAEMVHDVVEVWRDSHFVGNSKSLLALLCQDAMRKDAIFRVSRIYGVCQKYGQESFSGLREMTCQEHD